jgi:hypothetical protein
METRISRSGWCLACAVCIAFSCSSSEREFGSESKAGAAGQGADVAGAGSAGESSDGAGGEAGTFSFAGQAGALSDGGEAGAFAAAGQSGASGDCEPGESRSCSEGGALGPCAMGTQFCTLSATWSACSVKPAAADSCEPGNDDDCNGVSNQGCSCINGVTKKSCGACSDGIQVCADGKANQYSACQGAVKILTKYYPDADGDGYGDSTAAISSCIGAPSGYVAQAGDCCDDGGNLALAKAIHPGQLTYFTVPANLCGITWNYDCSANDSIQLQIPQYLKTCSTSPCNNGSSGNYDASSCGTLLNTGCVCNTIGGINTCSLYCPGSQTQQGCH